MPGPCQAFGELVVESVMVVVVAVGGFVVAGVELAEVEVDADVNC